MTDDTSSSMQIGAFALRGRLGRGGMGEVWRAVHRDSGVGAAIKVITSDYARDETFQAGFHREVQSMAMLDHPSVVRVFDYGEVGVEEAAASDGALVAHSPYVALELAEQGTLDEVMRRGLRWSQLRRVLLALLDALAHSHARGLVHRDLKPENVLAFADGEHTLWKLTDFGIAHPLDVQRGDGEHTLAGTPQYMAPEQYRGSWRDLSPATDLYALGCIAYEMTAGRVPMDGKTPLEVGWKHLRADYAPLEPLITVPEGFVAWVARLMAREPSARFQRAADAAYALAALGDVADESVGFPTADADAPTLATPAMQDSFGPTLGYAPGTSPGPRPDTDTVLGEPDEALLAADRKGKRAIAAAASRDGLPPLPPTWRMSEGATVSHSLVGVSPRLYGLRDIPLVGREEHRDALWDCLAQVHRDRRARLRVLEGPAGSGKSRLARFLCERADEVGGAHVLRAASGRDAAQSDALVDMLRLELRCEGLDDEDLREQVAMRLDVDDAGEWLVDDVSRLLDPQRQDTPLKAELHRTLLAVLEHLAVSRPLVVWMDDLQWSEAAVGFLEHLFASGASEEARADLPVMVVATVQAEAMAERPELGERLDALLEAPGARRCQVESLSDAENLALIKELLRLDDALVARVARRVDGNPLFAVQLVGDWVERGWLVAEHNRFRLREGADPELPDDLHAVWSARVERLLATRGADDRVALELAATLGRSVDAELWRACCAEADVAASESLVAALVDQRLARRHGSGWAFIHGMLPESLRRLMDHEGRDRLRHQQVARALAKLAEHGERSDLVGAIGRHRFLGGEPRAALEPLLDGARELLDGGDPVACSELVDLHERALDELDARGESERRQRLEGRLVAGRLHNSFHHHDEALEVVDEVRDEALEQGWKGLAARALLVRCRSLHAIGRTDGVAFFARRALELFEQVGDAAGIVNARIRLADQCTYTGDNDKAIEHYRVVLENARQLGLTKAEGYALWGLGYAYHQRLELVRARDYLEQGLQVYRRYGDTLRQYSLISGLGDLDVMEGRYDEAEAKYKICQEAFAARGRQHPAIEVTFAMLELERGDMNACQRSIERVEELVTNQTRIWTSVYCIRAALAAHRRDWEGFDETLDRLEEAFSESGNVNLERARALEIAAGLAAEAGRAEHARRALRIAADVWRRLRLPDEATRVEQALSAVAPAP